MVRVPDHSQTATAEAKPRCVQSILKPHGQSFRLQSDRYRRGKAEVRIINFKTTWSEFQTPARPLPPRRSRGAYNEFQNHMVRVPDSSQIATAEAKPRCV